MAEAYISSELRMLVRQRAAETCEYCLVAEAYSFFPHEMDHITSLQHGGETVAENLALACILCNKRKGTNLTSIDPQMGRLCRCFIRAATAGPIIFSLLASGLSRLRR